MLWMLALGHNVKIISDIDVERKGASFIAKSMIFHFFLLVKIFIILSHGVLLVNTKVLNLFKLKYFFITIVKLRWFRRKPLSATIHKIVEINYSSFVRIVGRLTDLVCLPMHLLARIVFWMCGQLVFYFWHSWQLPQRLQNYLQCNCNYVGPLLFFVDPHFFL